MGRYELIDLHEKKYGKLTVIEKSGKQGRETTWLCRCECGNTTIVTGGNLRAGRTQSCGCIRNEKSKERLKTHGLTKTRLYRIWKNMKTRCYNPKIPTFKYWGGKGITICDEWRNSFEAFYQWSINNGYSDLLTIDRINGNKGYEPSNCRWADIYTQNRNRSFRRKEHA